MTYTTAGTHIIHEHLGDEVIIANLDAGIYYSLRESGPVIWQMLLGNYDRSSIQSLIEKKYGEPVDISSFINRLLEENLLIKGEGTPIDSASIAWPARFSLPIFERYDEMQNLLMLDPIHEVDEQGWPARK